MTVGANAATALLIVAGLWIAIAAALSIIAAMRIRRARAVVAAAVAMRGLLAAAPARPLIVRPDGSIDIDRDLVRDLGLDHDPARIDDLGGDGSGIIASDLDLLRSDLEQAALSSRALRRTVRLAASNRVVEVRGLFEIRPEQVEVAGDEARSIAAEIVDPRRVMVEPKVADQSLVDVDASVGTNDQRARRRRREQAAHRNGSFDHRPRAADAHRRDDRQRRGDRDPQAGNDQKRRGRVRADRHLSSPARIMMIQ